ncbi:MAG: hypothetical protein EHM45_00580 [Desulfobacteraceae bacterium]|nr:MAG: hypothetical protein EHM45_00580 [Desulfobacteraceae bacterium]
MYNHSLLNQDYSFKCGFEKHLLYMYNNRVNFLLLFLFVFLNILIFGGCQSTSPIVQHSNKVGPQAADADSFDLDKFFKIAESSNKPDSSPETYYQMGNERLEFRIVSDLPAKAEPSEGFEILEDLQGNKYLVSKKIEFDHNDIAATTTGIESSGNTVRHLLSFHFKPECWDKVYDITSGLINKQLGIVRKNKVLSAPILMDAIFESAFVTSNFTESDMEWITSGFIKSELQIPQEDQTTMIAWLENRLLKNPNDENILSSLAWKYFENNTDDCKKTANLFKKMLLKEPNLTPFLMKLRKCYQASKNYNEAIHTYQTLLTHHKYDALDESIVHTFVAEAHYKKGNKKEALKELNTALSLVESFSFPFLKTVQADKIRKSFEELKTKYIADIKKMITIVAQ